MEKLFALIHWEDKVRGVIALENVVEPRKAVATYREGELIFARYRGNIYRAIISEIADDRSALEKKKKEKQLKHEYPDITEQEDERSVENDPEPLNGDNAESENGVPFITASSSTPAKAVSKRKPRSKPLPLLNLEDEDDLDDSGNDEDYVAPTKKKRKVCDIELDAKNAKCTESRRKLEKNKARAEVNREIEEEILQNHSQEQKIEILTASVTKLEGLVKALLNSQVALRKDMRQILNMSRCKTCLKSLYKKASPILLEIPTTPETPKSSHMLDHDMCPSDMEVGSINLSNIQENGDLPEDKDVPEANELVCSSGESDDLVFLGDSKYGIKINKTGLHRSLLCAKGDGTKFALHCLEFIVTAEECANLTVYGQGKGKRPMDENKRKALRSQIFSSFHKSLSDMEKERLWNDVIVPKINNKIRGIRNGKYKSM